MNKRRDVKNKSTVKRFVSTAVLAVCLPFQAHANPTEPTLVSGAALISNPSASVMQVVNTPGTIINWNAFSIASGETTRFVQLDAASAVLNRVTGGNPSSILGRLESNGRVLLVNPNGIVFGGSSVVDVAGLIASTRDISNENFTAGTYRFEGFGSAGVELQAGAQILTSVQSPTGGQVWLIGQDVSTAEGSSIDAPDGQVMLAAGSTVLVGNASNGNMLFNVVADGNASIQTLGAIAAERGAVGLFADFVNHQGTITAPNGRVHLHGGAEVRVAPEAVIDADGAQGRIVFESNNLLVYPSGNTHAVGGEVSFQQYEPSSYEAQASQLLVPSFYDNEGEDVYGVLVVYRGSDGNYAFRDAITLPRSVGQAALGISSFMINETIVDAMGNIVAPRTAIATYTSGENANGFDAEAYRATLQGVPDNHWATFLAVTPQMSTGDILAPRTPLADGGWVQIVSEPVPGEMFFRLYKALVANSADVVVAELPTQVISVTPMTDGTIVLATQDLNYIPEPPRLYGATGELLGTAEPLSTCLTDLNCRVAYVTPEGGVTVLGTNTGVAYRDQSLFSQHWVKVAPDYTPGRPISGEVGVASTLVTRPGSATNTEVVPTPPPVEPTPTPEIPELPPLLPEGTVPTLPPGVPELPPLLPEGTVRTLPPGVPELPPELEGPPEPLAPEFVESDRRVRAALAVVESNLSSRRAAEAFSTGGGGSAAAQNAARQSVLDLWNESNARVSTPDNNSQSRIARDEGQVRELIDALADDFFTIPSSELRTRDEQVRKGIELIKEYMEREARTNEIAQQTGLDRDRDYELLDALNNMDEKERGEFALAVIEQQRREQGAPFAPGRPTVTMPSDGTVDRPLQEGSNDGEEINLLEEAEEQNNFREGNEDPQDSMITPVQEMDP